MWMGRIIIIATCTIFWIRSSNEVQAVPIQNSFTERTALQGLYSSAQLDLPFLIGQSSYDSFSFNLGITTRLILDDTALFAAPMSDGENLGLSKRLWRILTEYNLQNNEWINKSVTVSNFACVNAVQSEGIVAFDRSVSRPRPDSDWAGNLTIEMSIYDFHYPWNIGCPGDFGFWYAYIIPCYPSYSLVYYSYGFRNIPVIDGNLYSYMFIPSSSGNKSLPTIPEPATFFLFSLGFLITLHSKNRI